MARLIEKCVCLTEQPQGIRPGPNAPIRLESDPNCTFCGGKGTLDVRASHYPPPIPVRNCDWVAWLDGQEEDSPNGYGATQAAAVASLMMNLEARL